MKVIVLAAIISLAFSTPDAQMNSGSASSAQRVAEIMKVMKEVQGNVKNQHYSQEDIHVANSDDAKQQEFENIKDAFVHIMADSCSQFCQSGGYGDGTVIGTAPFCDGKCGRDCKTHCTYANSDWEDYGHGCWSGNKICCCAKSKRLTSLKN